MVEIENPSVRVLRNGDYLAEDDTGAFTARSPDKIEAVEMFYETVENANHGEYRFAVPHSGTDTVIFYDGADPFIMTSERSMSLFFDGDEEVSTFEYHEPTDGFWDLVMYINDYTSRLSEYYGHADAYGSDVADAFNTDQAGLPRSTTIPEYESRIAFDFAHRVFEGRVESTNMYKDFPGVKKVLREAHIQTGEKVPEYLRVME